MAYADLYSDADLLFTYNNTPTYSTTARLRSTSGSGSLSYSTDVPANLGITHSAYQNGYAAAPTTYSFDTFPLGTGDGRTISAWMKFIPNVTLVSGTTSLGTSIQLNRIDPSSSASDDDILQINLGTYNSTVVGGSDRGFTWFSYETNTSTGTPSRVSGTITRKIPLNEWVHIAYVVKSTTGNIVEKVLYVNGIASYYLITTSRALNNPKFLTTNPSVGGVNGISFATGASPNVTALTSHYALWNRPLTKEEIRAQAWYGHSNEDYNTLILSDSPTYYADFDNTIKADEYSDFGATSWEQFSSVGKAGINIDQPSFANKRAWSNTLTSTSTDNWINNTGINIRTGIGELLRTGEFSIEFWGKIDEKPSSTRTIIKTDSASANNINGYFDFGMGGDGNPSAALAYRTGTATYTTGTLSTTLLPVVGTGQEACTLHPGGLNGKNFADNNWHHFVLTFSISDGASWSGTSPQYNAMLYADGARVKTRIYTSTFGWLNGTSPIAFVDLFQQTNIASLLRNPSIAALAFYPRRITEKEIEEHFIAGYDYISRTVKYYDGAEWQTSTGQKVWNGSAWIDWDAKRWTGSAWVTV